MREIPIGGGSCRLGNPRLGAPERALKPCGREIPRVAWRRQPPDFISMGGTYEFRSRAFQREVRQIPWDRGERCARAPALAFSTQRLANSASKNGRARFAFHLLSLVGQRKSLFAPHGNPYVHPLAGSSGNHPQVSSRRAVLKTFLPSAATIQRQCGAREETCHVPDFFTSPFKEPAA